MTRVVYGTTNISDTGTAVQFSSASNTRVMVFSVHSRAENTGKVYIGTDSAVSSAAGWELSPNEELTWRYRDFITAATIPPKDHWLNASDTSQKVDYTFIVEN